MPLKAHLDIVIVATQDLIPIWGELYLHGGLAPGSR